MLATYAIRFSHPQRSPKHESLGMAETPTFQLKLAIPQRSPKHESLGIAI